MEEHSNSMEKHSNSMEEESNLVGEQHSNGTRKGGLRTMPFIIVNEAFERMASVGLMPNMIFYLIEVYHMKVVTGTSVLSIWGALSNALAIFGAIISDAYLGRFTVIAIGSFSTLLGMTLLWLTSMLPQLTPSCPTSKPNCSASSGQLAFLFASFGLISIGSGCIRPCSIAFGADQLKHNETPNKQRLLDSYFNWYYAAVALSTVFAFTILVYIQDEFGWKVGLGVPALVMLGSALMFIFGTALYIKVKVTETPFSGFVQVAIIAFKNRKNKIRPDDCYNHSSTESDRLELTNNLRFLNKACVVKDSNADSSSLNPWKVSTVEKVETLKALIRIIPVWSTGILIFTTISQSFPTLQASTMDRHLIGGFKIPAGSFTLFMVLTLAIWIAIYDRVLVPFLAKRTNEPRGLNHKTRMGIGLAVAAVSMVVSAIVEIIRRDRAKSLTNPRQLVDMSAMWLIPQYALYGLCEAFNAVGQMEFYYSELPKSMSSVAIALFMVSNAISGLLGTLLVNIVDSVTGKGGKESWLSSNLNKGHLDYYYWLLAFLNLLNFFYYLICCRIYRSLSKSKSTKSDVLGEEGSDSKL